MKPNMVFTSYSIQVYLNVYQPSRGMKTNFPPLTVLSNLHTNV